MIEASPCRSVSEGQDDEARMLNRRLKKGSDIATEKDKADKEDCSSKNQL